MSAKQTRPNAAVDRWLRRARQAQLDALAIIQQGGSPEGILDRAYHAMLYARLAALRSVGSDASEAAAAQAAFHDQFIKAKALPRKLGRMLEDAAELAEAVESEAGAPITNDQAFEAYNDAVEFVRGVEARLGGS